MNSLPVVPSHATGPAGGNAPEHPRMPECHGPLFVALLAIPAFIFVVYLAYNVKRNVTKLLTRRSFVIISYYALLWVAAVLNLFWSCVEGWQCSSRKKVEWNLVSLLTGSSSLCLEISIMAFLLQDNFTTGLETLSRSFITSGIIIAVDLIFKAICLFGFGVSLYMSYSRNLDGVSWVLWGIYKLVLAGVYGYILFVHFSKWREKLPPRPAFHNYLVVMLASNVVALFGCCASGIGIGFGAWLFNLTDICYHMMYLPFLYFTFLADFFEEEDFLLDNAYYAEMRDAGFFDSEWD